MEKRYCESLGGERMKSRRTSRWDLKLRSKTSAGVCGELSVEGDDQVIYRKLEWDLGDNRPGCVVPPVVM